MFHLRIRTQLLAFLILQVGIVLALAGFYLEWQLRRQIESEIENRLLSLANTASQVVITAIGPEPVLSLLPRDETSRTTKELLAWITPLMTASGLDRLVIFDRDHRVLFDSAQEIPIGREYVRLRFDQNEIDKVWQGQASSARLFFDSQGRPFKSAYAPVRRRDRVVAILGVEGSAASLSAVKQTRRVMWTIAGISLAAAALSGIVFSRRITQPLERLRQAAAAIGAGDREVSLNSRGSEEITFLARTMQHMRQAILHREQNLRMMLAGVAHEIRNPLGGIELLAGLLEKDAPIELKDQVRKIRAEVRHLEEVVRDFLEYARPNESQRQAIDLHPLLEEICEQFATLHPHIKWRLAVPKPAVAEVDREQVRRIFLNLARNATEAMAGNGEIRILAELDDTHVTLSVVDNGPGIAEDIRDRIFEPFFTTRAQGSGLGLALVRRLVEQNHGTIELVYHPGQKGAHFRLRLPRPH